MKKPIPSFDINMTCLSFLQAFNISSYLHYQYKTILIVSCDIASRGLNIKDVSASGIFGDGVASFIVGGVENSSNGQILLSKFETHSEGFEFCQIPGAGYRLPPHHYKGNYRDLCYFKMDGQKVFKFSMSKLPNFVSSSLESVGLTIDDIDYLVPHQASFKSLEYLVKVLKINKEKLINIFKDYGNQVSASIPTAFHTLLSTGKVKKGDNIMLLGTAAGVSLGLVVWKV